ncbi:SCP-like protein [Aphelenchoides bicaudatus]|nr:SCP-like protein [Aphelenchoides bicaudatus]
MKVFLALVVVLAMAFIAKSQLTNKDRKSFLKSLNKLRSQVAKGKLLNNVTGKNLPKASNMYQVVWSKSLEKIATKILGDCTPFAFSPGLASYVVLTGNVSTADLLKNATTAWQEAFTKYGIIADLTYNTSAYYEYPELDFYSFTGFTQAVWAKSSKVGCASTVCNGNVTGLLCKFRSPGSVEGVKLYKTGKKQKCPKGSKAVKKTRLCKLKGKKGKAIQK